jgi:hypothetical protein
MEATMMDPRSRIGIAALTLAVLACGSDQPASSVKRPSNAAGGEQVETAPKVHRRGAGTVSAPVGAGGGTLELESGPRVEIPAGTLDQAQDIVLKEAPLTTAFANQEHERTEGPTFVVGPALEAPAGKSIRVSIPLVAYPEGWGEVALGYEIPVQQMVGGEDAEHTKWQYEPARLSGGRAVADVQTVNGYRLQFVLTNLDAQ